MFAVLLFNSLTMAYRLSNKDTFLTLCLFTCYKQQFVFNSELTLIIGNKNDTSKTAFMKHVRVQQSVFIMSFCLTYTIIFNYMNIS